MAGKGGGFPAWPDCCFETARPCRCFCGDNGKEVQTSGHGGSARYDRGKREMARISRYKVIVDGVAYQVQVEDESGEIAGVSGGPFGNGGEATRPPIEVRTHLPGNIYEVLCAEGDRVKKGDTLVIVEAMKMESPIYAPEAGVVQSVEVAKGQTVGSGEVLVVLA